MLANETCRACCLRSALNKADQIPLDPQTIEQIKKEIREAAAGCAGRESAPSMTAVLLNVIRKYQDIDAPMLEAKKRFNRLMLSVEEKVMGIVRASGDPIRRAIQFAMTGNYIDYGVIADVSEEKLMELMEESAGIAIPDRILQSFREEMASARSLLYITDNCGEIVMDKILIRLLREMYPDLEITVLVRGFDIQNDATRGNAPGRFPPGRSGNRSADPGRGRTDLQGTGQFRDPVRHRSEYLLYVPLQMRYLHGSFRHGPVFRRSGQ